MSSSSFAPSHYFPSRRRVTQACVNCRLILDGRPCGRCVLPTDVFFEDSSHSTQQDPFPARSWHLFPEGSPLLCGSVYADSQNLILTYFDKVNIYFPLLSVAEVLRVLEDVARDESRAQGSEQTEPRPVAPTAYCLLLLVLSLASLADSGCSNVTLLEEDRFPDVDRQLHERLWARAKLLLGSIASKLSLEVAQCFMLASIYMGATGQVADSFFWTRASALKCEAMASRALMGSTPTDPSVLFSDAFYRLYWVVYIYESDFMSEISINLPSGMAKCEDVVPYPVFESAWRGEKDPGPSDAATILLDVPLRRSFASNPAQELVAFQISTTAAIRRFLNRVHATVYDCKENYRSTKANYATWLLRMTEELWAHHEAIYHNLPDFLLSTGSGSKRSRDNGAHQEPSNAPWNVLRLHGRYCAAQYIIHRPFIEYVLLHMERLESDPHRAAILQKCEMCIEGCQGFIRAFDVETASSITGLFSSGMVTFTMVTILYLVTVCPAFREVLPEDVENSIFVGKQNLKRFSRNVKELEWHLKELDRLDAACRAAMEATHGLFRNDNLTSPF